MNSLSQSKKSQTLTSARQSKNRTQSIVPNTSLPNIQNEYKDSDTESDIDYSENVEKYLNNIDNNDDNDEPIIYYNEETNKYSTKNIIDSTSPIKENINSDEYEENISITSDEDDDFNIDSDEDDLKKMNKIDTDYLAQVHPECKSINNNEIDILSNIVYDSFGNIIDPFHKTIPMLTPFEKTRIIGIRTADLDKGHAPYLKNLPDNIIDNHIIARMELEQKILPYIIKRPLPNGSFEYWRLKDLEIIDR